MLQLPQIKQYGDFATVFPDSDSDTTFYVIPNMPRLRWENGQPVFLFLKYREAVRSDGADPTSLGGGYVQFDCELALSKGQHDQVAGDLQDMVNRAYRVRGAQAPPIKLASPIWHDSDKVSVSLLTFPPKADGTGFVTYIAGAGKPSLLGSANASFGMELTQRGAALLWQAFQMPTLPVAVVYHIEFMAEFPAVQMHVWVDASQIHHFHEEIQKDIDSSVWGDTDQSYTDTMQEVFSKWSVGGVTVNSFDPALAGNNDFAKLKKDMEEQGWAMMEQQLQQDMKDKFAATPDAAKGAQEDYKTTVRDYFQSFDDHLDVTFTDKSTVPWPTGMQASMTMLTSQSGPNGERPVLSQMFREVSLDDPFFQLLQVKIFCNCDFDADPIDSVIVYVTYGARTDSFDFRKAATPTIHTYRTYRDKALGDAFSYSYEVHYKASDKVLKSKPDTKSGTILQIDVKDMGYLKVDIASGAVNWDAIDTLQVRIRYGDQANGVDLAEDAFVLKSGAASQSYSRMIYAPVTHAYEFAVDYFFKNSQRITGTWTPGGKAKLFINDMFSDSLNIRLLAAGDWSAMQKIVVDLDYQDAAHTYGKQTTLELTATGDNQTWLVPVWGGGPEAYRYRQLVVYKDGRMSQGDWTPQSGSAALVVGEQWGAILTIGCMSDLIEWTAVRLVKVTIHYADPANGVDETEDFVFTSAKPSAPPWKLGIKDKTKTSYDYTATYYLPDGSHRAQTVKNAADETIILQLPPATP
jgi:hypothetical protein